jgi:threonine/homoserine/homoserine lactone efflux protein
MTQTMIALVVFLFPLAYSPGPGNLFFAANGARFGFRSTLAASLGYHLATWLVAAGLGLGLFAVLEGRPGLSVLLRLMGSAWVLWIAWRLFRSGAGPSEAKARPAGFGDGAVLLLVNPKAYVIIGLMFTQFLPQFDDNRPAAVLLIATVFTLNNALAFSVWTLAGDWLARRFRTDQGARRLNRVFGSALAAVAIWMALP